MLRSVLPALLICKSEDRVCWLACGRRVAGIFKSDWKDKFFAAGCCLNSVPDAIQRLDTVTSWLQ